MFEWFFYWWYLFCLLVVILFVLVLGQIYVDCNLSMFVVGSEGSKCFIVIILLVILNGFLLFSIVLLQGGLVGVYVFDELGLDICVCNVDYIM